MPQIHAQSVYFARQEITDDPYQATHVSDAIAANFDNIPSNVREELLLKLANSHEAAEDVVAHAILVHFDKLPENVRNLIFKLADNTKAANVIIRYLNELPSDVRNELLKRSEISLALHRERIMMRNWRMHRS